MYACVCVLKSHRRKIQSNLPCLAPVDTLLCLWNPLFLFPHPLFPLSFYAALSAPFDHLKFLSPESSAPRPCGQDELKFWPDFLKNKKILLEKQTRNSSAFPLLKAANTDKNCFYSSNLPLSSDYWTQHCTWIKVQLSVPCIKAALQLLVNATSNRPITWRPATQCI